MRKLTTGLMMAAVLGFGAMDASAQVTDEGAASVTIPTVLVISNATNLTIADTEFDFTAGNTSQAFGATTVDTRANVPHSVEVTGADLMNAGVSLAVDVEAAAAVGGGWSALSTTPVQALAGLARGAHTASTINFRTTANISLHTPGEYTGTITYTVISDL